MTECTKASTNSGSGEYDSSQVIIQGTNEPLALSVSGDIGTVVHFSAAFCARGTCKKSWDETNATFENGQLILPWTERETLALRRGSYVLDVKILDENDNIIFMNLVPYYVVERPNKIPVTEVL